MILALATVGGLLASPLLRSEDNPVVTPLKPGASAQGLTRAEPLALAEGMDHMAPDGILGPDGRLVVAWVGWVEGRERILLREAVSPAGPLGPARFVSDGALAWAPRLAVGDDAVWLAWSGRDELPEERGDLSREILLRRVDIDGGETVRLGLTGERSDAPDLAVDSDGFVHVAWESSDGERSAIAYQQIGPDGRPLGEPEILDEGWLARRPALTVADDEVWVAWDALVTLTAGVDPDFALPLDPDYDLALRRKRDGAWGPREWVDNGPGIQAAAELIPGRGGGVLLAYHSSLPGGLVKWWSLRRVRGETVETLAEPDPAAALEPAGEQQGAEFPQLVQLPSGGIALLSRSSQGAYLHLVGQDGTHPPLDLTRSFWGARGRLAGLVVDSDGSIVALRRARKALVIERFQTDAAVAALAEPGFTALEPAPTKAPLLDTKGLDESPRGLLWGDLHMHSALSDGTGTPDEIYARAWARGLDFAALTDHDTIVGWRMLPSEHHELIDATRLFDARDDFIALHAFEWTTPPLPEGYGHRNVYFEGLPPTPVYGYRHGYDSTEKLQQALAGERAFSVPHHTTWTGTDWDAADPTIQRAVEIVSVHGVAEAPGGVLPSRGAVEDGWVVDGLARGEPLGLLGGTDSHGLLWHHGLGLRRDPWAHGLTCAFVQAPGQAGLFEALRQRRTCASTGAPIAVILNVGELTIGQQGEIPAPVVVEYTVKGSRDLQLVTVIRDGQEVARIPVQGLHASGAWVDEGVAPGEHVYYLRVQQAPRGDVVDLAWSSPNFVTVVP